jgi:hypothetical protein
LVYFSRFGLLYQKNLATLLPTSSNQSIWSLFLLPEIFFMNVKCGLTFQIQSNNYIWGPFRET